MTSSYGGRLYIFKAFPKPQSAQSAFLFHVEPMFPAIWHG